MMTQQISKSAVQKDIVSSTAKKRYAAERYFITVRYTVRSIASVARRGSKRIVVQKHTHKTQAQ